MTAIDIDEDAIRKLAGLLRETGLSEISISEGERRIKVACRVIVTNGHAAHAAAPSDPGASAASAARAEAVAGTAVTSPMVGTAFLQPEPGAAKFVNPGDRVEAGQTLLIIEAMKVMNPIRAERGGVVKSVLISDGQPVEFGEPLMIIE
jgi:acetyl-CoA carboxylase biotin carboxyl carrier protein